MLLVKVSEEPTGVWNWMMKTPMSCTGMNSLVIHSIDSMESANNPSAPETIFQRCSRLSASARP